MRKTKWALALGLMALAAPLCAAPRWPDTFRGRLEALALIETLNAELLASPSATATLEDWCAAHHMAADATLHVHLLAGAQKKLSSADRRLLGVGPHEPVIFRRVELACGTHILSRADNWYVPSRLTPAMNRTLAGSDIPFGRVIRDLDPHRQTFSVTILWHPLPAGWDMAPALADHPNAALSIPPVLFRHHAVVYDGNGKPLADVVESYTSGLLDFAHGP